ncbi:unnamed protein product [Echinostoma caproni]|uniref:C2H2-type domain-containing protein n=1 Tax=Echinostoma caproni TaxID=27848 RepID=A0A183BDS7_9TREM|nr:unnamed protein product [Echinostoma caproni]
MNKDTFLANAMIGVSADDQAVNDQLVELELYELTSGHQLIDPKSCPTGIGVSSYDEYYTQFLGLYILKMDLLNAKFLWKRIPVPVKESSANLKILWNIGKLLLRKNYSKFFETASQIIQQPNNHHPESLIYIVTQIGQRQQRHLVDLITSAYSCISVEFVASLFCIPVKDVVSLFVPQQWELTANGKYLSLTQQPSTMLETPPAILSSPLLETNRSGLNPLTIRCPACELRLATAFELRKHAIAEHLASLDVHNQMDIPCFSCDVFTCAICGVASSECSAVEHHFRANHSAFINDPIKV